MASDAAVSDSTRDDRSRSGIRQRWLLAVTALAALLAGVWSWTPGLGGPYHFDDFVTPLNDPASQSLADWRKFLPVTLRPVTKLTYAVEAEAGLNRTPAPRRVVSLAFHAASAVLLGLLMLRLAPGAGPLSAVFLAVLWFIHPVHADNVLMLSGRTAVLSSLFLLASLLALDRSKPWLAALLFVLACLSRETALAGLLPLAVLAVSRPGSTWRSTLRELGPALIGGALVLVWILATPRYLHLAEFSFLGRPFWASFASQVGAVPVGFGLLLNPAALSIDYGIPLPTRLSNPRALFGLCVYAGAAAGILLMLKRSRPAAASLALWLAALLPTQSVVPKLDALTNRPLALALAGLLLLAAPFVGAAAQRIRVLWTIRNQDIVSTAWQTPLRLTAILSALALFALLAHATTSRAELFQSELSLWRDAASKSRTNERPHLKLAQLLKAAGRDQEAWAAVQAAHAIDPFSSDVALFSRVYRVEVSR